MCGHSGVPRHKQHNSGPEIDVSSTPGISQGYKVLLRHRLHPDLATKIKTKYEICTSYHPQQEFLVTSYDFNSNNDFEQNSRKSENALQGHPERMRKVNHVAEMFIFIKVLFSQL